MPDTDPTVPEPSTRRRWRIDPLSPISALTRVVIGFLVFVSVLGIGAIVLTLLTAEPEEPLGPGAVDVGYGLCVDLSEDASSALFLHDPAYDAAYIPLSSSGLVGSTQAHLSGEAHVCRSTHRESLVLWSSLMDAPSPAFEIAAFFLLAFTIHGGRRLGLFTRGFARRLRWLGWFLAAGAIGAPLVEAVAEHTLLDWMLTDDVMRKDPFGIPALLSPHWSLLFAGLGAISMGRVIARRVPMRERVEATV